jgi:hypothetical protein
MIWNNLKPRIEEAIVLADKDKVAQEVRLIYNELSSKNSMNECFEWLFSIGRSFATRFDEFRFVVIINPKK